jgi:glutathione synthase/RimK-type ligase-like ATP-grasp enzyme
VVGNLRAVTDKLRRALKLLNKRLAVLWYLGGAIPWTKVWRAHDRSSDVVVWIHHRYPAGWLRYVFREDTVVKDAGLVTALAEAGFKFRFVTGTGIDDLERATVLYSIHNFNPDRISNYSASLMKTLRAAEGRGCRMLPSGDEAEYWENKVFMHRRFDELGVHCPRTVVIRRGQPLPDDLPAFPLLVKEPHSSGSLGVHKVADADELAAVRRRAEAEGEDELLCQELIDMRRDLRVTLVGREVVHHYFRINTDEEWHPTSTSHGSSVDFVTFPEQWRAHMIDTFGRLGLTTGAFDVCWQHDDLTTEPYYLEVSPAYTPNPPPAPSFRDRPYSAFKVNLWGPESYMRASVAIVFDIHRMVVATFDL